MAFYREAEKVNNSLVSANVPGDMLGIFFNLKILIQFFHNPVEVHLLPQFLGEKPLMGDQQLAQGHRDGGGRDGV